MELLCGTGLEFQMTSTREGTSFEAKLREL